MPILGIFFLACAVAEFYDWHCSKKLEAKVAPLIEPEIVVENPPVIEPEIPTNSEGKN